MDPREALAGTLAASVAAFILMFAAGWALVAWRRRARARRSLDMARARVRIRLADLSDTFRAWEEGPRDGCP